MTTWQPQDRIEAMSWLLIACFASVLLLSSQSGASFLTYVLGITVIVSVRQWADVRASALFWLVSVTLAYFALSVFWSEPFSWRAVLSNFVRALLIFCFVVAFAEVQLRGIIGLWLRRGFVAVGLIAILAAAAVFVATDPPDGRLNGLGQLDTHVIAALVFGVVVICALQVLLRDAGVWKGLALVTIVAGVAAIALSDSRNALMSVAIGSAVLIVLEITSDRQRFLASISSVGLVIGVIALALFLDESTKSLLLPRGASFRPEIWNEALARIGESNYWIGLGVATSDDFLIDGLQFNHPHSLYIASLYQGGIIGLVLFLLVIGRTVSILFAHYEQADAKLGMGILGVALPAFMLDGYELLDKIGSTWLLFWFPVAIALGLSWTRQFRER